MLMLSHNAMQQMETIMNAHHYLNLAAIHIRAAYRLRRMPVLARIEREYAHHYISMARLTPVYRLPR